MIKEVRFEGTTYAEPPFKFEAGTPNIAGAVALGAAFDFMASVGAERIARHEEALRKMGEEALMGIDGLKIYGTAENKASVISFLIGTNHPYDTGVLLDQMGIAIGQVTIAPSPLWIITTFRARPGHHLLRTTPKRRSLNLWTA